MTFKWNTLDFFLRNNTESAKMLWTDGVVFYFKSNNFVYTFYFRSGVYYCNLVESFADHKLTIQCSGWYLNN